jgi:ubiquinone/menaquinone biosynthesis C-methylase UbiE
LISKSAGIDDLDRLRVEYAERERRFAGSDVYSCFNPSHLFLIQQRQRAVLKLLRRQGYSHLGNRRILELGCGRGDVLLEYLGYGTEPEHLYGTDLLLERIKIAKIRLPHLALTCSDGQYLPYTSDAFDLVLQYTVFSSILDGKIKANLAREMLRVIKPDGMILWYDFWVNPMNKQTRGIRPAEIQCLFPACAFEFNRITLAPPLTRRLAPIAWWACALLEKLKAFNTHYLVAIRKQL